MLNAPLVYHDPEKELLFTFAPSELGVPDTDQQRLMGNLTNQVISSLPAEKRKGYLLQPRNFLRLEGMLEAVLEADGITKEMIEEQRRRTDLLERLLDEPNEAARRIIVQENESRIDYEFFQLLTANIELTQASDRAKIGEMLLELRAQLLEWTDHGQEVAAREEAIRSLGPETTREELLDKLVEAALASEQSKVETMVAIARPMIDYQFYQQLTTQIESAQKAGETAREDTLKALRDTILELTAQIDAEIQQATAEATGKLRQLLDSEDPEAVIRANPSLVDEFFLQVLAVELEAATQSNRTDDQQKFTAISEAVMRLIQESQPAEIQFINELVVADYPEETLALLQEKRDAVDADLLVMMRLIREALKASGRDNMDMKLAQIQDQAAEMIEEMQ